MIAISWNCQNAGSALTVKALKMLKRKYDSDVVFLMETKNRRDRLEGLREKLKFGEGVYVDPEGLSGGLALW